MNHFFCNDIFSCKNCKGRKCEVAAAVRVLLLAQDPRGQDQGDPGDKRHEQEPGQEDAQVEAHGAHDTGDRGPRHATRDQQPDAHGREKETDPDAGDDQNGKMEGAHAHLGGEGIEERAQDDHGGDAF